MMFCGAPGTFKAFGGPPVRKHARVQVSEEKR